MTLTNMIGNTTQDLGGEEMPRRSGMLRSFEPDPESWQLRDDGRHVEGRIVPYNAPSVVVENGERFEEQFLTGSMTAMCQTAQRRGNAGWIGLVLDHSEAFEDRIGYATELEERGDGAWATFRLYAGSQLDKVRSMLSESHRGLSVFFDDLAPPRLIGGVRSRVQVHIHHVAATPWAVYEGALITAMRSAAIEGAPPPPPSTPALDEWRAWLDALTPTQAP